MGGHLLSSGFSLMFFPKEQGLLSLFFEAEILDWFSTVPMS